MLLWLRCGLGHGLPWLGGLRRFCSAHYVCIVYVSRVLFSFFLFASPQTKFSKVCGKIFIVVAKARSRALSLSRELSPSSAPNVSHSLRENLYEKEMRRPITVLWRSFGYVSRFTIELFALPIVYYIKATTNPPPLLPSTWSLVLSFRRHRDFFSPPLLLLSPSRFEQSKWDQKPSREFTRGSVVRKRNRAEPLSALWLREFRPWSATIKIRAVVNGEV